MARENPYLGRPFLVAVLDSEALRKAGRDGRNTDDARRARSVVAFLGGSSSRVRAAATRAGKAAASGKRPATEDSRLLAREFGPKWSSNLGYDLFRAGAAVGGSERPRGALDLLAEDVAAEYEYSGGGGGPTPLDLLAEDVRGTEEKRPAGERRGGADDIDFGDLSDFGRSVEEVRKKTKKAGPGGVGALLEQRDALPPYLASDLSVYPTDTLATLAERVWAASGIPPWRLNLSLSRPGEEPLYGYDLYLSDVKATVDPGSLFSVSAGGEVIAGVVPDRRLEQRRERARAGEPAPVQIHPQDEARQLEYRPGQRAHLAWGFDILTALDLSATERAIRDTYSRDLLYYGAVLKFWPRIQGPEAFAALFSGGDVQGSRVGRIAGTLADARRRSEAAQEMLDPVYRGANRQPEIKVSELHLQSDVVHVDNPLVVVLSTFDGIGTSLEVPVANLALSAAHVGTLSAASGIRQPNRKARIVTKRHASSYIGEMARRSLLLDRAAHAVLSRGGLAPATVGVLVKDDSDFATVSLSAKGRGVHLGASRRWVDEEADDIEGASEALQDLAAPGIEALAGGRDVALEPHRLSASWSWKHALTSGGFKELRLQVRRLDVAGFATTRASQQPNVIALEWHQGVWDYPPEGLARAYNHSKASHRGVANLYAGGDLLAGVMQRAFAGRVVRLIHRATEVRVEAANVAVRELEAIRATVTAFFATLRTERILHPQTISQMDKSKAAQARGKTKRLRKLQETDPRLYDLRLYGDGQKKMPVYAVLCQGDRQPMVYTDAERRRLTDGVKRRLVKYWNYTTDGPAYYDCGAPGSAYPYLGFRAGVHPMGYCLPCCKRAPPDAPNASEASRTAHRRCLKAAEDPDEGENESFGKITGEVSAADRHVLMFGKTIPPDRLGSLPTKLQSLFGSESPKVNLLGVMQQTPSVSDAGLMYSLAAALRRRFEALAERLAETCEGIGTTLGFMARGAAAGVPPTEVAAAYRAMASGEPEPGVFSKGGKMHETWEALTIALVREIYQVAVVTFNVAPAGEDGGRRADSAVTLDLDGGGIGDGTVDVPLLLVVKRDGVCNPLIALGGKEGTVRQTRRIFTRGAPVDAPEVPADALAQTVWELIDDHLGARADERRPLTALSLVDLAGRGAGWKIALLYGDLQNYYHGARVELDDGGVVWVPLAGGEASADNEEWPDFVFGPRRAEDTGSLEDLRKWLRAVGRAAVEGETPTVAVNRDGMRVGFVGTDGLSYYHAPVEAPPGEKSRSANRDPSYQQVGVDLSTEKPKVVSETNRSFVNGSKTLSLPYDPAEIDRAIFDSRDSSDSVPYEVASLARTARLKSSRFSLFMAEFAAGCRKERNKKVRDRLASTVKGTKFSSSKALKNLRSGLATLLKEFPTDLDAITTLLASTSGARDLIKRIGDTTYEFDAVTFHSIRKSADGLDLLKRFMSKRVAFGPDLPAHDPPNFYEACGGGGEEPVLPEARAPCRGGKLSLPEELFDPFCRLLLDEVMLPMELNIVLKSSSGFVEPFLFRSRKNETLSTVEL